VHQALCRIAAKFALGVYYNTAKKVASKDVRINTQWTHSQNTGTFSNVENVIRLLPNIKFLQMGKWKTDETFFARYYFEDGELFVLTIFHEAIALIAQLREPNPAHPPWEKWDFVMAPTPGVGVDVVPG
jgi:hypothetical protein